MTHQNTALSESKWLLSSSDANNLNSETNSCDKGQILKIDLIERLEVTGFCRVTSASTNTETDACNEHYAAKDQVSFNNALCVDSSKESLFSLTAASILEGGEVIFSSTVPKENEQRDAPANVAESAFSKKAFCNEDSAGLGFSNDKVAEEALQDRREAVNAPAVESTLVDGVAGDHDAAVFSNLFLNTAAESGAVADGVHRGDAYCKPKDHLVELYYKGLRRRRKMEEKFEALRAAQEKELEKCTFKPNITKQARALKRSGSIPACQTRNASLRHRFLLEAWKPELDENCRHIPAISRRSEHIIRRVRGGSGAQVIPVEERLHLDSARRLCRRMEDEAGQQGALATRTPDEIKAHIDTLYTREAKRLLALQKLREKAHNDLCCKASVQVNSDEVVRRLTRSTSRTKDTKSEEQEMNFTPRLSLTSKKLSMRARRRRLEQWYLFWCRERRTGIDSKSLLVKKINDALQLAKASEDPSLSVFCSALEAHEKSCGVPLWHSTCPPSRSQHINGELTFVPRVGNFTKRREDCEHSVHERLFYEAKKKQQALKDENTAQQEVALAERGRQKNRWKLASARSANSVANKNALEVESSCSLCFGQQNNLQSPATTSSACTLSELSQTSVFADKQELLFFSSSPLLASKDSNYVAITEDLCTPKGTSNALKADVVHSFASCQPNNTSADNSTQCCGASKSIETGAVFSGRAVFKKPKGDSCIDVLGIFVTTDLLIECALSRPTWSSDVAVRRHERHEARRRLQGLGKKLYRKI